MSFFEWISLTTFFDWLKLFAFELASSLNLGFLSSYNFESSVMEDTVFPKADFSTCFWIGGETFTGAGLGVYFCCYCYCFSAIVIKLFELMFFSVMSSSLNFFTFTSISFYFFINFLFCSLPATFYVGWVSLLLFYFYMGTFDPYFSKLYF